MMGTTIPSDRDHGGYGHRIWPPKEGYDLIAPIYDDWYWRPFWMRNEIPIVEQLAKWFPLGGRSLDLGCGTGTYVNLMKCMGEAIGIDPSFEMLKVARQHVLPGALLVSGRANAIPLRSHSVDMTIAARSLCHEADLSAAFRELARITRPGGTCIVSEVHGEHQYPRTRIPFRESYVYIETFKRVPEEVVEVAVSSGDWLVDARIEVGWDNLVWRPNDPRFVRIDKTSKRAIFFVVRFRRR